MLILRLCQSWDLKTLQKPGFADWVYLLEVPPFPRVFCKIQSHLSIWGGHIMIHFEREQYISHPEKTKTFPFWVYLKVPWIHLQKMCSCHFILITAPLVIPVENQGQWMTGASDSGAKLTEEWYLLGWTFTCDGAERTLNFCFLRDPSMY